MTDNKENASTSPSAPAAPTQAPMVLVSLRLPPAVRQRLMILAANETARRGKRVSVNTLILEAIEAMEKAKTKKEPAS